MKYSDSNPLFSNFGVAWKICVIKVRDTDAPFKLILRTQAIFLPCTLPSTKPERLSSFPHPQWTPGGGAEVASHLMPEVRHADVLCKGLSERVCILLTCLQTFLHLETSTEQQLRLLDDFV
jgi:hypothetical protein